MSISPLQLLLATVLLTIIGCTGSASTTSTDPSTTTTRPDSTTTIGVGLDLSDVEWVTMGPEGLQTATGAVLWPSGALFEKSVARDKDGGLVFSDGSTLWWFRQGEAEPVRVSSGTVRVVEVIGLDDDTVVAVGYAPFSYGSLIDGSGVDSPPAASVALNDEGSEVWAAANGWSIWIAGPVLADAEEGLPTVVEEHARLKVVDSSGTLVVDEAIGTDFEPWVRIHDFDGQLLIVSRGPIEPAMPEETFLVIDLGCDRCTSTFKAGATSASLVGADADWDGPVQFSDASSSGISRSG